MTIEFHTQYAKVGEKLINYIRDEVMNLVHLNKDIVRAEVTVKEDKSIIPSENKVCEIRLTVFGDNIFVHKRENDFKTAAKGVIKELKRLVKQQVKSSNEPPDQITTTVDV